MIRMTRRCLLATAAGLAASSLVPGPVLAAGRRPEKVLIVGAGPAGLTAAKTFAEHAPDLDVTLIGRLETGSAAERAIGLTAPLRADGRDDAIAVVGDTITGIDPAAGVAHGIDGRRYSFDRLVLAPGIRARAGVLDGYDAEAARAMPHGWFGGAGTGELGRCIAAMADGGTVVLALPAGPMRYPAGAFRRATEIATYLAAAKPRSKILIVDGADGRAGLDDHRKAWSERFSAGLVEWVSAADGGRITGVEVPGRVLIGPAGRFVGDVVSLVPAQEAGALAHVCGVAGADGWCPVDPVSMRSTRVATVFVAGDAARLPGEVKTGKTAVLQGRCAALGVLAEMGMRA